MIRCTLRTNESNISETENQDKINTMVAEQMSEECDVEMFEFLFHHVFRSCPFKASCYQMCQCFKQ